MKTVQTLFDNELVKEPKILSPIQKLERSLRKDLNDSIYKFKIKYNRVYYNKVANFPKGISKGEWLYVALDVWNKKMVEVKKVVTPLSEVVRLLDINKANQ